MIVSHPRRNPGRRATGGNIDEDNGVCSDDCSLANSDRAEDTGACSNGHIIFDAWISVVLGVAHGVVAEEDDVVTDRGCPADNSPERVHEVNPGTEFRLIADLDAVEHRREYTQ